MSGLVPYLVFMVLPFVLPPLVGVWKGWKWGLVVSAAVLLFVPISALLPRGIGLDPYSGSAWFACGMLGSLIVAMQAVAGRFSARKN